MNSGWILSLASVCCGADYAEQYPPEGVAQAQYTQNVGHPPASASARIVAQQPASRFSAQPSQQSAAQPASQFQSDANNPPTLPPTNASAFGQQGAQYNQPSGSSFSQQNNPAYPQGSSFTQQPGQTAARGSVFSTQPTASAAGNQQWAAASQPASDPRYANDPRYASDPRYSASATSDPRYQTSDPRYAAATDPRTATAPPLLPPANATQQPNNSQFGAPSSQFSNTLRNWGQDVQQLQQQYDQVQPYLSSLTNNPYAYVPAQPQPDPAANQYLAGNSQTADGQFGRSVLVNGQQNSGSSFGQYSGGQYASSQPYGTSPSQFTSGQPSLPANPAFDSRGQLYPPDVNANARLTSGQSAFTSSGSSNTVAGGQDPRLMQTPQIDPRYAQDPRIAHNSHSQDPRTLTLEPPLGSTLPAGAGQVATTGATGQLSSPYENVQTPRADGYGTPQSNFNNPNTSPNNATTSFGSGTKTEVPSLFTNVLPASNTRIGAATPAGGNQFAATTPAIGPNGGKMVEMPYIPLVVSLLSLAASIGANFYFGWNFTEYYFRYRKLLVEGDDDDRSRSRDEDRRR